ncbi:unnamed protein product [Adineta ricciae]|uniref:G-protein coupled receptors family 1 profile domain-containing protein n=1 Tax=Adineta ricciae TaxID=249248 RepID=A0A814E1N1_ADIRI|nr:unnamed protein product [Adineta ricciae]
MLSPTLTTTDTHPIQTCRYVSSQINYYFSIFLFIFGMVGNVLNIFVLSQRSLRSNPCAWLFLISSIANLIVILSGLTTRIVSYWTVDIIDTTGWICKTRVYVLYVSRTIASWLIILATIDRWLLSSLSARRRRLSTLKYAQHGTILVICLAVMIFSPLLYCYEANLMNTPLKCYTRSIVCRIFADQTYITITIILPLILMFLFGFMTMSNVRRSKHRVQTPLLLRTRHTLNENDIRLHRFRFIDRHLLIMLLVQISFFALLTVPQAFQQIYSTMTRNNGKSSLQITIENAVFSFVILLSYLASGVPFYIYTLCGGRVFREAFFVFLRRIKQIIICQQK